RRIQIQRNINREPQAVLPVRKWVIDPAKWPAHSRGPYFVGRDVLGTEERASEVLLKNDVGGVEIRVHVVVNHDDIGVVLAAGDGAFHGVASSEEFWPARD